jgi:hypothetical protein
MTDKGYVSSTSTAEATMLLQKQEEQGVNLVQWHIFVRSWHKACPCRRRKSGDVPNAPVHDGSQAYFTDC